TGYVPVGTLFRNTLPRHPRLIIPLAHRPLPLFHIGLKLLQLRLLIRREDLENLSTDARLRDRRVRLHGREVGAPPADRPFVGDDRKSTRLNSSHVKISYAVFCLKKKKNKKNVTILT